MEISPLTNRKNTHIIYIIYKTIIRPSNGIQILSKMSLGKRMKPKLLLMNRIPARQLLPLAKWVNKRPFSAVKVEKSYTQVLYTPV